MDVCVIASKCDCLQPRPSLQSVVLGCGWYTIELSITVGDVLAVYRSCDVRVWLWRCGVVSKRVARCESEGRRLFPHSDTTESQERLEYCNNF